MFPRINRIHGHPLFWNYPLEQIYWCYSASSVDKPQVENGNRVILPPSVLKHLAYSQTEHIHPLIFEVQHLTTKCSTYCGVLEFVANEGTIYMPCWLMEDLSLQNGDAVKVKSTTLPKATYVKLQLHSSADLPDVKAMKDTVLKNFSCLTVGHSILVAYNNNEYNLDVIEAKPAAAVCIEDYNCEVELLVPVQAKEKPPLGLPISPPIVATPSMDKSTSVTKKTNSSISNMGISEPKASERSNAKAASDDPKSIPKAREIDAQKANKEEEIAKMKTLNPPSTTKSPSQKQGGTPPPSSAEKPSKPILQKIPEASAAPAPPNIGVFGRLGRLLTRASLKNE